MRCLTASTGQSSIPSSCILPHVKLRHLHRLVWLCIVWATMCMTLRAGLPSHIDRKSFKEGLLVWRPAVKAESTHSRQPSTLSTDDSYDCMDSDSSSETNAINANAADAPVQMQNVYVSFVPLLQMSQTDSLSAAGNCRSFGH
jgi:hypothetical protein